MTLNMLVDTSDLAMPRLNRTIIAVTTPPTTLSPTSQRGASKEENDTGALSSPSQGLGFHPEMKGEVGKGYLNSSSIRRIVIFVIAEVAGWQPTKSFPRNPSQASL
jgi:hypothetical protein